MDTEMGAVGDDDFTIVAHDMVPAPPLETGDKLKEQRERVISWLQPTEYLAPGNEYMKHLGSYVLGTGKWVHESPIFQSWLGRDDSGEPGADTDSGYHHIYSSSVHGVSCLHVKGVAGSGKSVFSASTIDQLKADGNIVLFFFFRQIVDKNHDARYLIRDFAAQLLPHSATLLRELVKLSQDQAITDVDNDRIWSIICNAITEGAVDQRVYCIVDALDEMDEANFQSAIDNLIALGTSNPQTVKMMFTSRPLPRIEAAVQNRPVIQLKLDPVLLSPDVARYVDARMGNLKPRLSPEKAELVRVAICERASGLFLHARLVTDNLAQSLQAGRITEETLPSNLERLPQSLQQVYEEMLKDHAKRSGVSEPHQAKVLQCVTHSSRPLRLIELGSLISQLLNVDLRRGKELVRDGCGQLLELLPDETVSVIHHSLTEFLHDQRRKDKQDSFPVLESVESHDMLATLCLEYLNSCPLFDTSEFPRDDSDEDDEDDDDYDDDYREERKRTERRRKDEMATSLRLSHPLALYAVENLAFHFRKLECHQAESSLKALDTYFVLGKPAFQAWIILKHHYSLSESANVLHALMNVSHDAHMPLFVTQHLIEQQPSFLDATDSTRQTPLVLAARHGQTEVCNFLLSKGANFNLGCEWGCVPLKCAAREGHPDIVRSLLQAGKSPLTKNIPTNTSCDNTNSRVIRYSEEQVQKNIAAALECAVFGDNVEVLEQFMPFLPQGAASELFYNTKTVATAKMLLQTGQVDIDWLPDTAQYPWTQDRTKLAESLMSLEFDMVQFLLNNGANPNKRSSADETPLHSLCGEDRSTWGMSRDTKQLKRYVEALVQAGADINAKATPPRSYLGSGLTPLHFAMQKSSCIFSCGSTGESEEILATVLLSCGADVNAVTENGNSVLHLADPRHFSLIELLIEKGANVNMKNVDGMTPLMCMLSHICACSSSRSNSDRELIARTFGKLLDVGTDATLLSKNGSNLFHVLLQHTRDISHAIFLPFIKRLLSAGVDPNLEDNDGETPIFKFAASNYSFDRSSYSPTDDSLLRILIQGGLQLNVKDRNADTLLHRLLDQHGLKISDLDRLVRLGADPSIAGAKNRSLLQAAVVSNASTEWQKHLVTLGGDASAQDEEGNTVLHLYVNSGDGDTWIKSKFDDERFNLLIESGADVFAKNMQEQSILHAIDSCYWEAIFHPSLQSMNVNDRDISGLTPLHNFATMSQQAVKALLDRGADLTLRSHSGLLPLHVAAKVGETDILDMILGMYPSESLARAHISSLGNGQTALHYACATGNAETVAVLLHRGANPTIIDSEGLTPLHCLSESSSANPKRNGYPVKARADEIVRMLFKAGADINAATFKGLRHKSSQDPQTSPLDMAVRAKRWEIVRELLACGAEVAAQHLQSQEFILATDKDKALKEAIKLKNLMDGQKTGPDKPTRGDWCGRWAASQSAQVDSPGDIPEGWTLGGKSLLEMDTSDKDSTMSVIWALDKTVDCLDYDSIMEYVQMGGSLYKHHPYRKDFFERLVARSHLGLLERYSSQIIARKPNVTLRKPKGGQEERCWTLLGTACENWEPSMHIIEFLVDGIGVNVNGVHQNGSTDRDTCQEMPIHVLCRGGKFWRLEALRYLLSKGADLDARNEQGATPLMLAIEADTLDVLWSIEIVRVLLQAGADVNAYVLGRDDDAEIKQEHNTDSEEEIDEESESGQYLSFGTSRFPSDMSPAHMVKKSETLQLLVDHGLDLTKSPAVLIRALRKWMVPGSVRILLANGIDPNYAPDSIDEHRTNEDSYGERCSEKWQMTPERRYALHEAARPRLFDEREKTMEARQKDSMEQLFNAGADPYAGYADASFVLQRILEDRGHILFCLSQMKTIDVDRRGFKGRTMLISACVPVLAVGPNKGYYGDELEPLPSSMPEAVLELLRLGADVLALDDDGRTALHWFSTQAECFDESHQKAFKELLQKDYSQIGMVDKQGRLPIHLALETFSGRLQSSDFAIRHLMSLGADITVPDPVTGNSALHYIAPALYSSQSEHTAVAEKLLRDLVKVLDINSRNNAGETPVFTVVGAVHPIYLYDERSNRRNKAFTSDNSIHVKVLETLLVFEPDLFAVDNKERTLLHVAAQGELDHEDYCARERVTNLFEKLLDLGVDPHKENNEMRSAIDIAVARNFHLIVDLFSEESRRKAEERKANVPDEDEAAENSDVEMDS